MITRISKFLISIPLTKQSNKLLFSSLSVYPDVSLIDEEVTIIGNQLVPGTTVKLETSLVDTQERFNFHSSSLYKVGNDGVINTAEDAPLGDSSYQGVHRSGPLWSVRSKPKHKSQLWPVDVTRPLQYQLTLSDVSSQTVISRASATKSFINKDVRYGTSSHFNI